MNKSLKIASPWSQLGLFLLLLGGALVLTTVISAGLLLSKTGLQGAAKGISFDNPELIGTLKLVQAVSSITIFLLPAIAFAFFTTREKPLDFIGFKPAQHTSFYLVGTAILLLSFPLQGWLGEFNRHMDLPKWAVDMENDATRQIEAFLKTESKYDLIINVIVIALIPAICEEACFRGVFQRILINIFKNPWIGIIATAIFFSAFHMQFLGFLPRFFMGILLGAVYWYSGSLWTSIVAHFFVNGVQVVAVAYYPNMAKEDPTVPVWLALGSLVVVVALLMFMIRRSKTTYAAVYESYPVDRFGGFPS